jgi:tRNA U55 pseudouridine synthase TruB
LYILARRGQPVQKPAREVSIFRIRLLAVESPRVRFEVDCSAGTYIRTLCADIGRELGCGGHLSELIRLESGGFTLKEALTLEDLEDLARRGETRKAVIPMARALPDMAAITAGPPLLEKVRHGRPLTRAELGAEDIPDATPTQDGRLLKLIDTQGELIAVLKQRRGGGADLACSCAVELILLHFVRHCSNLKMSRLRKNLRRLNRWLLKRPLPPKSRGSTARPANGESATLKLTIYGHQKEEGETWLCQLKTRKS